MSGQLSIHDAEKLLGGYATGSLTEDERRDLFAAALEHQALFDAMADEEALRELLADPAARAELLSLLAEGPESKMRPLWRRHPAVLGLAASLLIAVTTGIAYLRSPELRESPAAAPAAPKALEVAPDRARPAAPPQPPMPMPKRGLEKQVPQEMAPLGEAVSGLPATLPEAPAAVLPVPAKATAAPAPAPQLQDKPKMEGYADLARARTAAAKEVDARQKVERKAMRYAPAAAAGAVSGSGAQAPAPTQDQAEAQPQAYALEAKANLAPGIAPSPAWAFEKAQGGSVLLRVRHAPGTFAYLLHRTAVGAALVPSQRAPEIVEGLRITRFRLPVDPGPMDLYILSAAPPEPLSLPAEGPVQGFRARVEVPKQ